MTRDERIEELKKAISGLDEEEQQAVTFMANRYKVMQEVCRAEKLTAEQREELMREGREKATQFCWAWCCWNAYSTAADYRRIRG